jgi:sphinganine-1-phosphate aldolase
VSDLTARIEELRAHDLPTKGGTTLAYVYDSGLPDVDAVAREALVAFADSNGLDPTAFPSLLRMENELVGFAADLLRAPASVVGSVTSGGTESCLLAVKTARDARPEVARPNVVVPSTAHAAFHKAAHYFGVELRAVPVGTDFRADPAAMGEAVDDSTVLVVASAPSYAHGVIDPVQAIAGIAVEAGTRCHVDACIGGWVLPYAERLGREVPPWTFDVDGVTSISVDLHKYAYTPKGASLLLHRDPALRRAQYFASADWPGYTMLNSTFQSTKSGGPLAAAWAVVTTVGDEGYERLARTAFAGTDAVVAGVAGVDGVDVVASPDSTLVALATDDTCDAFTVADEMTARGWYVQPQLSFGGHGPTLHLTLSAATDVDGFLAALAEAVDAARRTGPVHVDADVAAVVAALDPATLGDDEFDGLLAAAGLPVGGDDLELPERMAGVNALLDLAPPRLREAVLLAFLDRLYRPVRPA